MAEFNEERLEDLEKRNILLQAEVDINADLIAAAKTLKVTQLDSTKILKEAGMIQSDLLDTLESEQDLSNKIRQTNEKLDDLLLLKIKHKDTITKQDEVEIDNLIEELSISLQLSKEMEKQAEFEAKEVDSQSLANELKGEALSLLQSSTGAVGDMVAAFAKGGGLIFLLQQAVSFISDMFNTYKKLNREFGMSVSETFRFQANIAKARMESGFLGASFDELSDTATEILKKTGRLVPPSTIAAAEKLGKALGDQQAGNELARISRTLGITETGLMSTIDDTLEMLKKSTDENRKITDDFVDRSAAIEMLSVNQFELLTATKERRQALIEEGLLLKNQGFQIKELNRIRKGGLDIEEALRNEVELQLMTGKDINMNLLNQGILQQDNKMIAEGIDQVLDTMGQSQLENLASQPAMLASLANTLRVSEEQLGQLVIRRRELSGEGKLGAAVTDARQAAMSNEGGIKAVGTATVSDLGSFESRAAAMTMASQFQETKTGDLKAATAKLEKLINKVAAGSNINVSLNLDGREIKQIKKVMNQQDSIINSGTQ